MPLSDLREKIENRSAKLAVIGLGYVGLPVAKEVLSISHAFISYAGIPREYGSQDQEIYGESQKHIFLTLQKKMLL